MTQAELESRRLYHEARALGAVETWNDCPGGGLSAPEGASEELCAAVAAYKAHERERYALMYGALRREYYSRKD